MRHIEESNAPARSKAKEKKKEVPVSDVSSHANPSSNIPSSNVVDVGSAADSQACPKGSKAAKKQKNNDVSIANLLKGQNKLLDLLRKKQNSFDSFADEMLMSRSLDGMDEEALAYFKAKRKKAIACLNEES
jgi:hypothetical protein